jgi:hypothetical protein
VLRPDGLVVAAAISRYRTVLAGLFDGDLHDPVFGPIAERGIRTGFTSTPTRSPIQGDSQLPVSTARTNWSLR